MGRKEEMMEAHGGKLIWRGRLRRTEVFAIIDGLFEWEEEMKLTSKGE